jgi:membrane fusion protein
MSAEPLGGKEVDQLPLFRPESLRQHGASDGEVLLVWPLPLRFTALFAAAMVLLLGTFALFGEYTRKARIKGYIVPTTGAIRVFPPETSLVAKLLVEDGTLVRKGDQLLLLAPEGKRSVASVASREATLRVAALDLEIQKTRTLGRTFVAQLRNKAEGLRAELTKIDAEVEIHRRRLSAIDRSVERYRNLATQGFSSPAQVEQQTVVQLEQQATIAGLDRTRSSIERELRSTLGQVEEVELKTINEVSSLGRQLSALRQDASEAEARVQIDVRAPVEGYIGAVQISEGQLVTPTQAMLQVIPVHARLEVRLLAPAHAIGLVRPGQTVQMRYAAYPFQRFGMQTGTIRSVSRTAINPGEHIGPPVGADPVFMVHVDLLQQELVVAGRRLPLQSGMAVEADVHLERRPIYQWILEPLATIWEGV